MTAHCPYLITFLLAMPLVTAAILMLIPSQYERLHKGIALVGSLLVLACALSMGAAMDLSAPLSFEERYSWIPAWNASYHVGLDTTNILLVLLSAGLFPLILISGFSIRSGLKSVLVLLCVFETAILGAFVSLDLLLFYVFWELTLLPIFFLIGIWGGGAKKRTTLTFFIYTMVGSLAMLLGITLIYHYAHGHFDALNLQTIGIPSDIARSLFPMFALAFLIKTPIFGLHRWLPDTYADAPTPASIALSALLSKLGIYGLIRFCIPLFGPAISAWQTPLLMIAASGIVYASLLAWTQGDIKRIVAYSSMAHMGVILLGVFSLSNEGLAGAQVAMVSHGLSTTVLFFMLGTLEDNTQIRSISAYGGLARTHPLFAIGLLIGILSSISLPGTSGFVGEILILLGSFTTSPIAATLAVSAAVLGAMYSLRLYQALCFGKDNSLAQPQTKLPSRLWALLPALVLLIALGIRPGCLLDIANRSTAVLHATLGLRNVDPSYNVQTQPAAPESDTSQHDGSSGILQKGDSD